MYNSAKGINHFFETLFLKINRTATLCKIEEGRKMFKLRLLLIGIACSCAFARNMARREEDNHHHHHHHHQPSATIADNNSNHTNSAFSSVTDSPADLHRVAETTSSAKLEDVGFDDLSYAIKKLQKKIKGISSTHPETHKRSAGEPFVKNLPKSCCG